MKNAVYCVIANFNGQDWLADCLQSLDAQTQAHQVIVVDNGSSDDSLQILERDFPKITLIKQPENRGFTGGVNPGIQQALQAGAKYIALFNNDAVADRHWLKRLVNAANQHPKAGIITSKILRDDQKHLDSTGDFYSIYGLPFPRGRNELDKGQYDDQTQVFAASGGASLYRAELFEDIGLFDDDFFAYFEDVDISFRAQLAGWQVRYEPTARVYHRVSATASKLGNFSLYHSSKNFMLLYAKNMPMPLYWKYWWAFSYQWLRWLASSTLRGHCWTFVKGALAAVRLHFSTVKKRRQIQQGRKVTAQYIDGLLYHHRPPRPPKIEESAR